MAANNPTIQLKRPTKSNSDDLIVGKTIGNYRVVRRLGEGGMGTVYELMHDRIGKRLALKVLHRRYAEEHRIVRRFFDEARAVNLIGHANIVDIIDCNHFENGTPYLTMEFLNGRSLAAHLQEHHTLAVDEIAQIFLPLCSALGAAHQKGIVHRDLKPDNIFLLAPPIYVKVLDFGVAKLQEDTNPGDANGTKSGVVLGTPRYMSPEQAMGRSHQVDHRTDIYALGIILYEMLTGQTPFSASSVGDLMLKHLQDDPPPMPRDIPQAWKQVTHIALAKKREHRFQSMEEFADAITTAQRGEEIVAIAPPDHSGTTQTLETSPIADHQLFHQHGIASRTATQTRTRTRTKGPILLGCAAAVFTVGLLFVMGRQQPPATTQSTPALPLPLPKPSPTLHRSTLPIQKTPSETPSPPSPKDTAPESSPDSTQPPVPKPQQHKSKTRAQRPRPPAKSRSQTKPKPQKTLSPADTAPGKLVLKVTPWAKVKIDGKDSGYAPRALQLAPGRHRVSLSGPNGKSKTVSVTIQSGKTEQLRLDWTP